MDFQQKNESSIFGPPFSEAPDRLHLRLARMDLGAERCDPLSLAATVVNPWTKDWGENGRYIKWYPSKGWCKMHL